MIQIQTYLNIADNTGVKKIMCLKVLGNNKKIASIGDIIIAVVKKVNPNMLIKQSQIVRAVIVRTKKLIKRKDGSYFCFNENAAVIINTDNNLKGTRIFGPIPRELKEKNFLKIISLASEII